MKHSGPGIASFVLSLVSGFMLLVIFGVAGAMETATPGGIDEESVAAMWIGLLLFMFLFLDFVALGLGIGGLVQRERNKLFAILGSVFAGATIILTVLLLLVGLAME